MTESKAIEILRKDSCYECAQGTDSPVNCEYRECRVAEATRAAIKALEECLRNKDFLDFLSDKMNPNDFETYLRLYNALEEKGCEE